MHSRNYRRKKIEIVKSSGIKEKFSPTKLHRSLLRSGLSPKISKSIAEAITKKIKDNCSTREIYHQALRLVHHESPMAGIHYSLKKSLLGLGPSGHAFEHFVARYFKELNFETQVGITLHGKFITHEVDVIATKATERVFAECKFHNDAGKKNDIKIALYVKARWDDLRDGPDGDGLTDFYLASNTAFSEDVITYANGAGLKLLGVNAPFEESFLDKIKKLKLYPITSLKRLKKTTADHLIEKNILICKDLIGKRDLLMRLGMEEDEVDLLLNDVRQVIQGSDK